MTLTKLSGLLLVLATIFSSCKKEAGTITKPNGQDSVSAKSTADIYIAGWTINPDQSYTATYWKNGNPTSLGGKYVSSALRFISVQGNDIYAAGVTSTTTLNQEVPTIWKNGVATQISAIDSLAKINDMIVQGSDIYVVGSQNGVAALWKNGVVSYLTSLNASSQATGIYFDGSDIYISGQFNAMPVYWKNGNMVILPYSYSGAVAGAITVNNGSVYVAGGANTPTSWKDGVYVGRDYSQVSGFNSIVFNGGDLYISGLVNAQFGYFKNETLFENPVSNSSQSGKIIFYNDTLYAAGSMGLRAVYWKNDPTKPIYVGTGLSGANDIKIIKTE